MKPEDRPPVEPISEKSDPILYREVYKLWATSGKLRRIEFGGVIYFVKKKGKEFFPQGSAAAMAKDLYSSTSTRNLDRSK